MRTGELLVANSSLHTGTALAHLQNQQGGTGGPGRDIYIVAATESYLVDMTHLETEASAELLEVEVKMTAIKAAEQQTTIDIEQELENA